MESSGFRAVKLDNKGVIRHETINPARAGFIVDFCMLGFKKDEKSIS